MGNVVDGVKNGVRDGGEGLTSRSIHTARITKKRSSPAGAHLRSRPHIPPSLSTCTSCCERAFSELEKVRPKIDGEGTFSPSV